MSADKSSQLTDTELEIMLVLWELGSGTVRQVYEVVLKRRHIAYTTVMTMLNILENKGHLRKHKKGRAFVYEPVRAKNHVISRMVDDFLNRLFDGSARPLILSLIKDRKLSKRDLDEISRLIKESE